MCDWGGMCGGGGCVSVEFLSVEFLSVECVCGVCGSVRYISEQ